MQFSCLRLANSVDSVSSVANPTRPKIPSVQNASPRYDRGVTRSGCSLTAQSRIPIFGKTKFVRTPNTHTLRRTVAVRRHDNQRRLRWRCAPSRAIYAVPPAPCAPLNTWRVGKFKELRRQTWRVRKNKPLFCADLALTRKNKHNSLMRRTVADCRDDGKNFRRLCVTGRQLQCRFPALDSRHSTLDSQPARYFATTPGSAARWANMYGSFQDFSSFVAYRCAAR